MPRRQCGIDEMRIGSLFPILAQGMGDAAAQSPPSVPNICAEVERCPSSAAMRLLNEGASRLGADPDGAPPPHPFEVDAAQRLGPVGSRGEVWRACCCSRRC
jgi:hypothetical protein